MSAHNDGGPVHPVRDFAATQHSGMSLRDYLAAKAMQALLCADTDNGRIRNCDEALARRYYDMADAMLAAREEKR